MRSTIRLGFADFWPGFRLEDHILFHAANACGRFTVTDPAEAELLIFSVFGQRHRRFTGTKLHYTEEKVSPPRGQADFFIGGDHIAHSRYLRLPGFVSHAYFDQLSDFHPSPLVQWRDREFCNFIYSWSSHHPIRRTLFERLNEYRTVASPGRYLHNVNASELANRDDLSWRHSKVLYQRRFRFTIACENWSHPGYVSEKLYDALLAGTIPIYWGSPTVTGDVDERAFINCHAFRGVDDVVATVRDIDADPRLASAYFAVSNPSRVSVQEYFDRLVKFLDAVASFAESQRGRSGRMRRRAVRLTVQAPLVEPVRTWQSAYYWLGAWRRRVTARHRNPLGL